MRFNVLDGYTAEKAPPEVPAEKPVDKTEETPKPERKMCFERLKGILDRAGCDLANNPKLTIEEKIDQWVSLLKWAMPLVPDDKQHFKAQLRQSIENPTEKDFISERTLKVETPKEQPNASPDH